MTRKMKKLLETVLLRGIEGIIGDQYLKGIAEGNTELLYDFYEAPHMAEQVYMQWRGLGLK